MIRELTQQPPRELHIVKLTPVQQAAAESECLESLERGSIYWLWGKNKYPREQRDDIHSMLRLSLWKACRNRQINPRLQQYSLLNIFKNQMRSDYHQLHKTESKKYGIKSRDVGKESAELLRQAVREVSINVEDDEHPAYHVPAKSDPLHDVEVQSQWEALTDIQRAFIKLKVDGVTQAQICERLQLTDRTLMNIVVDLKRIYGVESVKLQRV